MSHYYSIGGKPRHTVRARNGEERLTWVSDARKKGWFPSVTTYLDILDKPQLKIWGQKQVLGAAVECPIGPGEDFDAYYKHIEKAAFKQVGDAADIGTTIHAAVEDWFMHGNPPHDEEVILHTGEVCQIERIAWPVIREIEAIGTVDACEKVVVDPVNGFGGSIDILYHSAGHRGVIDLKSQRTKEGRFYKRENHPLQVSAYHMAHYKEILDTDMGWNVYFSTTEPGKVKAFKHTPDELRAAWDAFLGVCAVWRYLKKYDPRRK